MQYNCLFLAFVLLLFTILINCSSSKFIDSEMSFCMQTVESNAIGYQSKGTSKFKPRNHFIHFTPMPNVPIINKSKRVNNGGEHSDRRRIHTLRRSERVYTAHCVWMESATKNHMSPIETGISSGSQFGIYSISDDLNEFQSSANVIISLIKLITV